VLIRHVLEAVVEHHEPERVRDALQRRAANRDAALVHRVLVEEGIDPDRAREPSLPEPHDALSAAGAHVQDRIRAGDAEFAQVWPRTLVDGVADRLAGVHRVDAPGGRRRVMDIGHRSGTCLGSMEAASRRSWARRSGTRGSRASIAASRDGSVIAAARATAATSASGATHTPSPAQSACRATGSSRTSASLTTISALGGARQQLDEALAAFETTKRASGSHAGRACSGRGC
jgi:hypothetical protein